MEKFGKKNVCMFYHFCHFSFLGVAGLGLHTEGCHSDIGCDQSTAAHTFRTGIWMWRWSVNLCPLSCRAVSLQPVNSVVFFRLSVGIRFLLSTCSQNT